MQFILVSHNTAMIYKQFSTREIFIEVSWNWSHSCRISHVLISFCVWNIKMMKNITLPMVVRFLSVWFVLSKNMIHKENLEMHSFCLFFWMCTFKKCLIQKKSPANESIAFKFFSESVIRYLYILYLCNFNTEIHIHVFGFKSFGNKF